MYYTIYKVTNLVNNKIYIGKHQTSDLDDAYMGSGTLLAKAKKKYGLHSFKRDILFVFDNEDEMNAKEAELVTEEFVKLNTNYNRCPGGNGGWGYVNLNKLGVQLQDQNLDRAHISALANATKRDLWENDLEWSKRYRESLSLAHKGQTPFLNRQHTDEAKYKQSKAASLRTGSKNSSYGTCWIYNDHGSIKIKKVDLDKYLELGYNKGRKMK